MSLQVDTAYDGPATVDDGALAELGAEGWEAYASVPAFATSEGYYSLDCMVVLLKRPLTD